MRGDHGAAVAAIAADFTRLLSCLVLVLPLLPVIEERCRRLRAALACNPGARRNVITGLPRGTCQAGRPCDLIVIGAVGGCAAVALCPSAGGATVVGCALAAHAVVAAVVPSRAVSAVTLLVASGTDVTTQRWGWVCPARAARLTAGQTDDVLVLPRRTILAALLPQRL